MSDDGTVPLSDLMADLICEAGEDRDDGRGTYLHIDPDLAAERIVRWLAEHDRAVAAAAWEEACQWNREQGMGISNSAEHNPYTK